VPKLACMLSQFTSERVPRLWSRCQVVEMQGECGFDGKPEKRGLASLVQWTVRTQKGEETWRSALLILASCLASWTAATERWRWHRHRQAVACRPVPHLCTRSTEAKVELSISHPTHNTVDHDSTTWKYYAVFSVRLVGTPLFSRALSKDWMGSGTGWPSQIDNVSLGDVVIMRCPLSANGRWVVHS